MKPDHVIHSRPWNFRPIWQWTIETVKKQPMFFEIGLKNFAILTGKHLCWGLCVIKLQTSDLQLFLKETPTQVFHVDIAKILRTASFIEHLRWLLLKVLPQYSKVSWGVCSLIPRLHVLSILIKNLHKTLHK